MKTCICPYVNNEKNNYMKLSTPKEGEELKLRAVFKIGKIDTRNILEFERDAQSNDMQSLL